jgi:hypothetical protein
MSQNNRKILMKLCSAVTDTCANHQDFLIPPQYPGRASKFKQNIAERANFARQILVMVPVRTIFSELLTNVNHWCGQESQGKARAEARPHMIIPSATEPRQESASKTAASTLAAHLKNLGLAALPSFFAV